MWPIEEIPDADLLDYRIHNSFIVEGEVIPGAFQERGRTIENKSQIAAKANLHMGDPAHLIKLK